jgi:putative SOS response-associated peptidase YedK
MFRAAFKRSRCLIPASGYLAGMGVSTMQLRTIRFFAYACVRAGDGA